MSENTATEQVYEGLFTLEELGVDLNNYIEGIPTGGFSFGASRYIAPWSCMPVYRVGTENDPQEILKGEIVTVPDPKDDSKEIEVSVWPPPYPINSGNRWSFLTYKSMAVAAAVAELLDGDDARKPNVLIRYTCKTRDVINEPNLAGLVENMGETLKFEVEIKSLSYSEEYPGKRRHQYQFISLLAAVASFSQILPLPKVTANLSALIGPEAIDKDDMSEDFFHALVGDPSKSAWAPVELDLDDPAVVKLCELYDIDISDVDDDETLEIVPILPAQRVEMWKALAQSDPKKYTRSGSKTSSGRGASTNVDPKSHLNGVLGVAANEWNDLWVELTLAPDPSPEQRYGIPCVTEVFGPGNAGLARAKDAAADQLAGKEIVQPGESTSSDGESAYPPIPEAWASSTPEEICQYLRDTDPDASMSLAEAKEELFMNPAQLKAWRAVAYK